MTTPDPKTPTFHLADSHGYILLQGHHHATARLSLQHFLWQRILKFVVHPSILPHLPPAPSIADVAAGNGLWALDAAHELPTSRIHGFDIDLTQAPAKAWLPLNVELSEWNLFEDPPPEFLGTFDLVHVRLLVLVLSGVERGPVLRRLRSLLKPGGWLQWEDLDCTRMHVKRVDAGVSAPSLDAIVEMSRSGDRHDWVARLPEELGWEGFGEAVIEEFGDPVELGRALNDLHLMTMEEFAAGLVRVGEAEAAGRVAELVRGGYNESLRGAAICYPRVCCIARNA